MDRIHLRIAKQSLEIGIALLHAKLVADFVKPRLRALADGVHVGKGMVLIDRNELFAESESHDSHIDFP